MGDVVFQALWGLKKELNMVSFWRTGSYSPGRLTISRRSKNKNKRNLEIK